MGRVKLIDLQVAEGQRFKVIEPVEPIEADGAEWSVGDTVVCTYTLYVNNVLERCNLQHESTGVVAEFDKYDMLGDSPGDTHRHFDLIKDGIDNLELLSPLLAFEDEHDFYTLYIFKRKKDQPEALKNESQSVRTIKTYHISSIDYLAKRYDEIKHLCEYFRARAYLSLNCQNHKSVSLDMLVQLATRIQRGVHNQAGLFDSVVGQVIGRERRWIVDIDTKDPVVIEQVSEVIVRCRPEGPQKIIAQVPTKSGVHLITGRFDVQEFKRHYPEIEIQKKNPTLLYLPPSLS